ncbi:MAG: Phosphate-import ATP-binding protein PhnC, partial [Pseudomonadota bacterium]
MNMRAEGAGLLSITGLYKEYRPGEPVLKNINLEIEASGVTAIIGPSGTGKSTLIRCINRLIDPTAGQIKFRGEDLAQLKGKSLREARCHIGMVFQEYNLVERLTVMENVLCGKLGRLPIWRPLFRKFSEQDISRAFDL